MILLTEYNLTHRLHIIICTEYLISFIYVCCCFVLNTFNAIIFNECFNRVVLIFVFIQLLLNFFRFSETIIFNDSLQSLNTNLIMYSTEFVHSVILDIRTEFRSMVTPSSRYFENLALNGMITKRLRTAPVLSFILGISLALNSNFVYGLNSNGPDLFFQP